MFSKILVALDTSDHSGPVLSAVAELGGKFGADVHVLHVLETGFVGKAGSVNLEDSEEVHKLVNDAVASLESKGLKATGAVRASPHASVAVVIHEEAREVGADVIVTGTRGLGDVRGMLVGSTTHKLLHLTELPVLVIP